MYLGLYSKSNLLTIHFVLVYDFQLVSPRRIINLVENHHLGTKVKVQTVAWIDLSTNTIVVPDHRHSGPHRIVDKLFSNTRYFIIKSNNFENVEIAKDKVLIIVLGVFPLQCMCIWWVYDFTVYRMCGPLLLTMRRGSTRHIGWVEVPICTECAFLLIMMHCMDSYGYLFLFVWQPNVFD